MIKTCMMSFCKKCKKTVSLYENIKSRYRREYYCEICKEYVRELEIVKEDKKQ